MDTMARKRRHNQRLPKSPQFEELEPRVLYSADLAPQADAVQAEVAVVEEEPVDNQVAETEENLSTEATQEILYLDEDGVPIVESTDTVDTQNTTELIFISNNLANQDELLTGLDTQNATVVELNSGEDGWTQILDTLAQHENLDAVHFITHGDDASLKLGDQWINSENLHESKDEFQIMQLSLSENADLLFYGCNLAESDAGQTMLSTISEWTGADIAASTDLTGGASHSADWELEYQVGQIESDIAVSPTAANNWDGVLNTYTVTSTADNGAGTLREAIVNANANAGIDTIEFSFAGGGPHVINLTSGLPFLTEGVIIDGTSEPDYSGTPVVVLNGSGAGVAHGLQITADNCEIRGLVIQNFGAVGILVNGASNCTIEDNYIGTDNTGTIDQGNSSHGISLNNGAGTNTVRDNVISGNDGSGININNSSNGNIIVGNTIGLDTTGTAALGNANRGINIATGTSSDNNIIGGTSIADRNIISANGGPGIKIAAGTGNQILGNYIGTDITGALDRGNASDGIWLVSTASGNTIGGSAAGSGNLISGNGGNGIFLEQSDSNTVRGNLVGTNAAGTGSLANTLYGINLDNAGNNTIGGNTANERNVISGNSSAGIALSGASTTLNQIQGNYIGVDAAGNVALGNNNDGIIIHNGAHTNTIGGDRTAGEGNVISGNTGALSDGIEIDNAGADSNKIYGNYIGTNHDGTAAISNGRYGVVVYDSVQNTEIGGTGTGQGNIISSNTSYGVVIDGNGVATTTNNVVQGNIIGLNEAGTAALGNGGGGVWILNGATGNTVGGTTAAHRNTISGNTDEGIEILGVGTDSNQIIGNYIGTSTSGTVKLGNLAQGIKIQDAANTIVGGVGQGNIISGNNYDGIFISGSTASGTIIQGNYIGTDVTGTASISNDGSSAIRLHSSASNTLIGGTNTGEGNLIAFNQNVGVGLDSGAGSNNAILGNSIYSNGNTAADLGIDLGEDGVTANDAAFALDVDTGTNDLQNFPVLISATSSGGNTTITGQLDTNASTTYRIEFFSTTLGLQDPSGYGEGQTYLGFTTVTTDGSGNATINTTLVGVTIPNNNRVSATATVDFGGGNYGSTSEFSQNIIAAGPTQKIYWAQPGVNEIRRSDMDGSNIETLVSGINGADYIAIDENGGKIYWTDESSNKIQRANLDGSKVEDLVITTDGLNTPKGIALDVANGKMYWSDVDNNKIQRANLDGTGIEDLITTGLTDPRGVALDLVNNKLYWVDSGTDKIQRSDLDGSNVEDLITGITSDHFIDIDIDVAGGKIYWANNNSDTLHRANLDGSSAETLVSTGMDHVRGIELDLANDKIYWGDRTNSKIQRANLDGSGVEDVITGLSNPHDVAVYTGAVSNLAPVITSDGGGATAGVNAAENQTSVTTVTSTDADLDTVTYSITGGADAASFTINSSSGVLTFQSAPDFETPSDSNTDNVYEVIVTADDGNGGTDSQTINVTVTDETEAPVFISQGEGLNLNTDGGNDVYLVADQSPFSGQSEITIEVQFAIDTPATGITPLISYADGSNEDELFVGIDTSGEIFFRTSASGSTGYGSVTKAPQLLDGEKHSIAVTWENSGGILMFYVDGEQLGLGRNDYQKTTTIDAGGTLTFGQHQTSPGNFDSNDVFSGTLYDLRVFDDVRTATEIAANYQSTLPYDEAGLIANWTFDDLSTNEITTDSVSGNNLTVQHASGGGFSASTANLTLEVDENTVTGTVIGSATGTDTERNALISSLLAADTDLTYNAETGKFYKYVDTGTNWATANSNAQASSLNGVSGQLVTVESANENQAIVDILNLNGATQAYLRASDASTEDQWRWGDQDTDTLFWQGDGSGDNVPGRYSNWDSGNPNDFSGQDYAKIFAATGLWDDVDGTASQKYIIEYDADAVLDNGQPLTYSIQSQTVSGAFAIDADSGQITVADGSTLDYESNASHTLTVRVTDVDSNTYDETFTVSLNDVDDSHAAPTNLSSGIELNTDGGNDAYFEASDGDALLGGLSEVTVEFQLTIDNSLAFAPHLLNYSTAGEEFEFRAYLTAGNTLTLGVGGNTVSMGDVSDIVDGEVHHVAISWDNTNGNAFLYIDGELRSTAIVASGHPLDTGGTLTIGQGDPASGKIYPQAMHGTLYDIRIWDEVRSAEEIALNYQQKFDTSSLPAGLIANWQMNGFNGSNDVVDVVSANNLSVGHASGTGFTSSTPVEDLNVNENSPDGTSVGYVVPSDPDVHNDIIADGLFLEEGGSGSHTRYDAGATFGAWTVDTDNVEVLRTVVETSPLGGYSVDLNGVSAAGAISQTLSTEVGKSYQVTFALSGWWGGGDTIKDVRVSAAGQSHDFSMAEPDGWSSSNMLWEHRTFSFIADSTSTTLQIASLDSINSGGPIVADFQVVEVPQAVSTILNDDPTLSYDAATGKFYRTVHSTATWHDARTNAHATTLNGVGGQLVTIGSEYENQLVQNMASTAGFHIWLGAADVDTEGQWHWYDSSGIGELFWSGDETGSAQNGYYTNWYGNDMDPNTNWDAARMLHDSGKWGVVSDTGFHRYIIEWDASEVLSNFTFALTDNAGGRFAVDNNSGEITVADGSLLDYETDTSHDITVRVSDASGATYDEVMTIAINNQGGEPDQSLPATQTINEDNSLVFSSENGNAITVSDTGSDNNLLQVTLTSSNGTLRLSQTTGLSIPGGSDDSAHMVIQGSESDINAALENAIFTPDASFSGAASIQITTAQAAGLEGYYSFDAGNALDESVGVAQNGTITNATPTSDLERGDVLSFDGTNDYVNISSKFSDPANVTLAGWVNYSSAPVNGGEIISIGNDIALRVDDWTEGVTGFFWDGSSHQYIGSKVSLADGNWHHIAFTFDDANNTQTLYIDGEVAATASMTDSITYTAGFPQTTLGTHANLADSSFDFSGLMDDARIYTRALSADEVAALAVDQTSVTGTVTINVDAVNSAPVFGDTGTGSVTTAIPGSSSDAVLSSVVQPDGKIIVGGYSNLSDWDFTLVRYNSDGSLDDSFGTQGIQTIDTGADELAFDLALQSDGKIVMVGQTDSTPNTDLLIIRLNSDGSLDSSFDSDGRVTTDINGNDSSAAVAIQSDGKIVVAGYNNAGGYNFTVSRYNTDGSLDTGFDSDGLIDLDFGGSSFDMATSIALQGDGKILIGGLSNNQYAMIRLNTDGSMDTSFDSDGMLTTDFGAGSEAINALAIQPDGKIIAGGTIDLDFALARYNSDGSLDTSFGTGGMVQDTGFGGTEQAYDIALQNDGRILITGYSDVIGDNDILTQRYLSDGSTDPSFNAVTGSVLDLRAGTAEAAYGVHALDDGSVLVAGYTSPAGGFVLTKYDNAGQLDTSFAMTTNLLDGNPTFVEDGTAAVLDGDVEIFDAELSAADNFNGATLQLIRNGGTNSEDVFSATGTLSALTDGGSLIVGGTTIGTVTTNSAGTLLLTFNSNATNTLVNSAMQQIAYSNSSDTPPASVQIDWTFHDGSLQTTGNTTVNITAVNDDPTNTGTVPSNVTVTQDISTAIDLSGLVLADVDAAGGDLLVALGTTTNTLVTAAAGTGITISNNGSNTVWLEGTVADLNNYFSNPTRISYLHATPGTSGNNADTIAVWVSDQGNTGTGGGGYVSIGNISVDITAVNNDPVITSDGGGTTASVNAAENQTSVTTVTATDADLDTVTYSITGGADQTYFQIDTNSGVLSFKTAPDLEKPSDHNSDAVYEVEVTADDGNGSTDVQTLSVTITNINEAPTITQEATFTDSGQALGSGASIDIALGDLDGDGDLDMVVVNQAEADRIYFNDGAGNYTDSGQALGSQNARAVALGDIDGDGDLDMVVVNHSQNDQVYFNDGSGTFTNSGQSFNNVPSRDVKMSDVDADGDLDLVMSNANPLPDRVFLNDGNGTFSNSGQALGSQKAQSGDLADVDGDGDLDYVAGNKDAQNKLYLNDGSGTFSVSAQNLGAAEATSTHLADIDGDGDVDIIFGNISSGSTVYLNDGTGTFTDSGQSLGSGSTQNVLGDIDGDGDLDLVQAQAGSAANKVFLNDGSGTFSDSGQSLGSSDTRSARLGDIDGDGDLDIITVNSSQPNLVYLNDSSITSFATLNLTEGDPATTLTSSGIIGDMDSADFDGGNLSISYSISGDAGDQLSIENQGTGAGQIGFDGSNVSYEGTNIGTVNGVSDGVNGTALQIDFNANATPAAAHVLLNAVTFENTSGTPAASRTLSIAVSDGDGAGSTAITQVINIATSNNDPVITSDGGGATASVNAAENQTSVTTITATDAELDTVTYSITGGADAALFSVDTNSGVLTFDSTPDFETATDFNTDGVYEVEITADDGNGGTDVQTLSVTVTDVNEAPTAANNMITTNEDTTYTFSAGDFGFSDVDSGNALSSVEITSLESVGALKLSGANVTLNQVITVADINAGNLTFEPVADANGTGYDSFDFSVNDGVLDSATSYTMTVDVTAVNDAPLLTTNTGAATTIGGTVTITTAMLNEGDVDDAGAGLTYTVTGTSNGQVELASNPGVGIASFTQADIDANDVVFVHDGLSGSNGTFDFSLADGLEDSVSATTATFAISIGGATSDSYATDEDTAININAASGVLANDGQAGSSVAGNVVAGFDAMADSDGNGTWSSDIGSIDLTAGTGVTYTPSPDSPPAGITAAFDLNGSSGFTASALDSYPEIDATQSATLETWVKFDAIGGNQIIFDTGDSSHGITLLNTGSEFRLEVRAPGGSGTSGAMGVLTAGAWHHIAMTIDLDGATPQVEVWLDGSLELSTLTTNFSNWSNSGFGLGATNGTAAAGFTGNLAGQIAHFRVHDQLLDSADISNNAANPGGGAAIPFVAGFDDSSTTGNVTINADGSFSYDPNGQFESLKPGQSANDTFDYTYDDGLGNQETVTVTLTINGINDSPAVATNTGTSVTEASSGNIITTAMLNEGDVDDAGAELTYSISTDVVNGTLRLNGTAIGVSDTFTQADIDANLLTYDHDGSETSSDSFAFSLADGGEDGATPASAVFNFTVTNTNDTPVITQQPGGGTYLENGNPGTFVDVTSTVTDADGLDFDGGVLSTTITANGEASDRLHLVSEGTAVGEVGIAGSDVTYNFGAGAVTVGSFSGGNGHLDPFLITFNSNADATAVSEVARQIAFMNVSEDPSSLQRTIETVITDGDGGTSNTDTRVMNVTPRNDEPAGSDGTMNVTEDTDYTFTVSDFGFSDTDGDAFHRVWITTLPAQGTLKYSGSAFSAGNFISAADITAGLLTYTPPADVSGNGVTSFTFEVQDDGGTANFGIDRDQSANTITIDITAQPDAPEITSDGGGATAAINADEGQTSATTVTAIDADGDTLSYAIIGGADSALFSINTSSGELSFLAAPDFATPTDSNTDNVYEVTVEVSDGNGGTDTQSISVTINDRAELAQTVPVSDTTVENTALVFTGGNAITVTDNSGANVSLQVSLSVTNGTLTLSQLTGITIVEGADNSASMILQGTESDLNAALDGLTFNPGSGFTGNVDLNVTTSYRADLIANYTFEGGNASDQSAGTAYDGTLNGDATTVIDGTRGEVLSLDGVGDNVTINSTFGEPTALTVGGWVNFTASSRAEFISIDNSVVLALDATGLDGDGVGGGFRRGLLTWNGMDTGLPLAGTGWHHVMLSYDDAANAQKLYIDGVEVLSDTFSDSIYYTGATTTYLGAHPSKSFDFNGMMDDVRFYTRALSAEEVSAMASETDSVSNTVSISVSSAGNDAPVITSDGGAATATINAGEHQTTVTTVAATDVDLDTLSYSISGGVDQVLFAINSSSGVLTFTTPRDFETPTDFNSDGVYEVEVTVDDGNGGSDVQTISVTVTDLDPVAHWTFDSNANDNSGSGHNGVLVDNANIDTSVATNKIGSGKLDLDGAGDLIDLSTSAETFASLTQGTIAGWVKTTDTVNFQTLFSVTDHSDPFSYASFGVYQGKVFFDVAENSVYLTDAYTNASVADGTWHHIAITVDGSGNSFYIDRVKINAGDINYGSGTNETSGAFLNSINDVDMVNIGVTGESLGFTYDFNGQIDDLRVYDRALTAGEISTLAGPPPNNSPVITSDGGGSSANINAAENQTAVTTITATDADLDTLSYSITGGADQAQFNINGSSGVLTFISPKNFEAATDGNADGVYEVEITVDDGNGGSDVQTLSVTVTNVDEAPNISGITGMSFNEGGSAGGNISATDPDGLTDGSYYHVSTPASNGTASIDPVTGNWNYTPTDPDWFGTDSFVVTLTDDFGGTATVGVNITVNNVNDAPVITSDGGGATALINIAENQTAVTTVTSSDIDGGVASYSISGGTDQGVFSIDAATGVLSFNTTRDFETAMDGNTDGVYEVEVTVDDGNGGADIQTISVAITDVNEMPTSAFNILNTQRNTTLILPAPGVLANDSDPDGDALNAILVTSPSNGSLTLNADGSLTYVPDTNFVGLDWFTYRASDGVLTTGIPTRVDINVLASNTAPDIVSDGGGLSASVNAAENQTSVTTIAATDADGDSISYTISGGADAALFTLDNATGVLQFATAPDFESPADADLNGVYEVVVQADDSWGGLTTQTLSITVTDTSEAAPSLDDQNVTLAENASAGQVLHNFDDANSGNDLDADGEALSYSLIAGNDDGLFAIDATTGVVTLVNTSSLDYESNTSYILQVEASGGLQSTTAQLSIQIENVNEAPVVTAPVTLSVNEDETLTINQLSVSDPDAGNADIQITITATHGVLTLGDQSGLSSIPVSDALDQFVIRGSASALNTALANLQFTPDENYNGSATITVVANDLGNTGSGSPLSDTETLSITIIPVNDEPALDVPDEVEILPGESIEFSTALDNLAPLQDFDSQTSNHNLSLSIDNASLSVANESLLEHVSTSDSGHALQASGDLNTINQILNALVITPTEGFTGELTLDIYLEDEGGINVGAARTLNTQVHFFVPISALPDLDKDEDDSDSESENTTDSEQFVVINFEDPIPQQRNTDTQAGKDKTYNPVSPMDLHLGAQGEVVIEDSHLAHRLGWDNETLLQGESKPKTISLNLPKWLGHKLHINELDIIEFTPSSEGFIDVSDTKQAFSEQTLTVRIAEITGASLVVGSVVWLLKSSSILSSLLVSYPAWRGMDPLPVLLPKDRENEPDAEVITEKPKNRRFQLQEQTPRRS